MYWMIGCVVHYQNVTEVCNGCCRDMNWMCRFVIGMSQRYVLDMRFIIRMLQRYVLDVQDHCQNVAKTFKIKSEAVIVTP
jgi:hypothetical protein